MQPINKLGISFDVSALRLFLEGCDYFGEYNQRASKGSPHTEMSDIWARYKNPKECIESGDFSSFGLEHKSEWLKDIKEVKDISYALMGFLDGKQLGGVLITKLPPGGKIKPHTDSGWHAEYYDKYLVSLKNESGARFCFDDVSIEPKEGEVYAFRNDVNHWVTNDSENDRIAMIICIKQTKLSKEGLCLGEQQ